MSLSQRYFDDGRLSAKRIERARLAARLELEPIQAAFQRLGWERAVGSSGTVRVIAASIREIEPIRKRHHAGGPREITAAAGRCRQPARELDLDAVSDERRPVFPGGVVILAEIIAALGIEQMRFVEGALRDGLLYDMVGRMTRSDARERTVGSMQRRYHVDAEQAERVEATAMVFLSRSRRAWGLEDPLAELALAGARDCTRSVWTWRTTATTVTAPICSRMRTCRDLRARSSSCWRAWWVQHRRKLTLDRLEDLIPPWDQLAIHLIVLLRIAVLLHRGRSAVALPNIELTPRGRTLELRFPPRWLSEHPLTVGGPAAGDGISEAARAAAARVLGRSRAS